MKLKLTKSEIAELIPKIQSVLDTGKQWENNNLHHPAGAIIKAVLSIKGMKKNEDGFDTNGWQYDWWQHFTYKGKDYTLSGSGYYGGHAFGLSDE